MKDTNKVAVAVIKNEKNEFLLVTRTEFPNHYGEWAPIAGHVRKKETIKDALIRESKEELNLVIRPIKQIAQLPQDIPGDTGFWWECKVVGGSLTINSEIDKYGYFSASEVKGLKLWPATKKFFENYVWPKTWNLKFSSLKLPDDIFNLLLSGKKTVETRSRNPKDAENDYTNVKPGDTLHFKSTDTGKVIEKTVVFNHVYDTLEKMVEKEDIEKILPGIGSKESMLNQYEVAKQKWGKKYKFELENYGVVAIGFK